MGISDINLSFDPQALAFLKEQHGSALTFRTSPRHGCCGGSVLLPIVEPGAPHKPEGWEVFERQGVHIYCETGLDLPSGVPLKVGLDKLLKWRKLWIEGLNTQPG
jgi:hypothetical protein